MIGYVTLGTNDRERSAQFYDAVAGAMGVGRMFETDQFIAWGEMGGAPGLAATRPHDGKTATPGNGTMVALQVDSVDMVHKVHRTALNHGGTDEGAPGPRGDDGFYAGYFRDPDGNKLNVFTMVK
ncbi:VOC family protein [Sphingomicrobium lutaoense]|uniref:Catechol 2,3-dioxygenase-like lactoylglutathione lyase family enzyme n=1 Tax=Sphingomicrobium lutaoense TaxID=515949 RepID=A0A839Z1W5_9SPHN|nr:VOC family protein [Sphingomicrobium lutaoense]MBB3764558.1 catechol 2,3-dioxygenase-like lactoylglutathione lyase family enzyme [Sphingomicrobium lutaoense]